MTKNKSRPIALLAAGLLWAGFAQAQESTNASGGDATGTGGTASYSEIEGAEDILEMLRKQ